MAATLFAGPATARGAPSAAVSRETAEPPIDEAPSTKSRYSDEIQVTATAGERSVEEVPAFVTVATREELTERRLGRALPEALGELAGVAVQKTSNAQVSPYLRGFTGFRTLLLVDGIRLNNSAFRDGPNEYWGLVDLYTAERLEVVPGPGSALYGSDAVGGTAALVTAEPGSDSDTIGADLFLRGATAEQSGLGHGATHGKVGDRFDWSVGATVAEIGELEGGGGVGRQEGTDFGFDAGDLKGRWSWGDGRTLTLAHQRSRLDDVSRAHATIDGVAWRGTRAGTDLERTLDFGRDLTYLQWNDTTPHLIADSTWASLSWQQLDESQDRVNSSLRRELSSFDVGTAGVQLKLAKETPIGRLTYGADYYRDEVDSERTTFDAAGALLARGIQGPVADDAIYELTGLYVQDEATLSPRFSVVAGARYTDARLDAGRFEDPVTHQSAALERSWSSTVGHLRALARLDEEGTWRLWAGWGQAFRAPNLSDLTRLDVARSDELETAAVDLDPEEFTTWELGLRWTETRGTASFAVYETDVDGLIVRVPTGATVNGLVEVTKRNAGDGRIRGVDFAGEYRLGNAFKLSASASWLEGDVDGYPSSAAERVREPLDKAMAPWGRIALAWEPAGGKGWLEGAVQRTEEQDRLSSRDRADTQRIPPGGSPGYTLWTLRGGWTLERIGRVSLALENLTDAEYRVHGSGVNGAGRNLVATFASSF